MHSRRGRGRGYYRPPKPDPQSPETCPNKMINENRMEHTNKCCGAIEIKLDLSESDIFFMSQLKKLWTMRKH